VLSEGLYPGKNKLFDELKREDPNDEYSGRVQPERYEQIATADVFHSI